MSDLLKIELLKIANDLSKEHENDYTEQRIMGTYWCLYELFESVQDGLNNRTSNTLLSKCEPFSSNQTQS